MAWTWPTAAFFIVIFLLLCMMAVWEYFSPGGEPRHGILGLDTTRGDRLFISLLGSGFIHIAWLGLLDISIWGAFVLSIVYAIAVFKWVCSFKKKAGNNPAERKNLFLPSCSIFKLKRCFLKYLSKATQHLNTHEPKR